MGMTFSAVQRMDELGLFRHGGMSILDIGSSNLYSATPVDIKRFLEKYGRSSIADVDEFSKRVAADSRYDPVSGGRNTGFVGELFEKAGMQYVSFDITPGYRTTILDLNHEALPDALRGKFDLVLNFGTTEHILNQHNCFKVIHDATKVGGFIFHELPAVGHVDHGYITYTGRCFFDVAGFNEYDLVACWFDGPFGGSSVLASLESYRVHFPVLETTLKRMAATEQGRVLQDVCIPDIGISVVYRKVKDRPFLGALESSTSVGAIPQGVAAVYGGTDQAVNQLTTEDQLTTEELALRDRLLARTATLDEALRLYSTMSGRGLAFPLAWEELVLRLCLRAEPNRQDLRARLRLVLIMQNKVVPPELELAYAEHAAPEVRGGDGRQDAAELDAKLATEDMDPAFPPIYERYRGYSMTSVERMYALFTAIKYLEETGIAGDIVECGVWRGGSMMLIAHTLSLLGSTTRDLYLFDTYERLARPDEERDVDVGGNRVIDGWLSRSISDEKTHWAKAGIEEVRANLLSTGYPAKRLHFVKGMVERTVPDSAPKRIALLRLATDRYLSTKHELEHLFDRVSRHGVLILDDYGHCKGARAAVDEFLQSHRIPILLHRVDYSGRAGIKVSD